MVDVVAWGMDVPVPAPDGTWTFHSGSSLAAAHMTGLIATILGEQRGLSVREVRERLRDHGALVDRSASDAPIPGTVLA